ncbi:MFS general substrate transporter [Thozetella sp. PMI_491]|nr:MFS general substrate transporter [Thozetella sp. PMI_491]
MRATIPDRVDLDGLFSNVADETLARKLDLSPISLNWNDAKTPAINANKGHVGNEGTTIEKASDDKSTYRLPYSTARCIGLVVTPWVGVKLNTFSIQAVVIILPSIGRDLGVPDSRLQWILSAYSLAFGCFLLFWGRIADVYGMKPIFICGTAWLALTALVCPFMPNEIGFDLVRGLQGLGAAANVPTALGILGTVFPPGKAKTNAFAAYGAGAPLGSILGNILAGVIAAYASWRWVFVAIALLSTTIAVAGFFTIPMLPKAESNHRQGGTKKPQAIVDWLGAFLVTLGMFLLLFSLTDANIVGWSTPRVPILVTSSLVLLALFVTWQVRLESAASSSRPPLIKMSLFRSSKRFSTAMLIMALFSCSFNGFLVYATYFYQSYQGLDVLQTTLRFVPTGVAGILASIAVAFALDRVPTWIILLFGNACVALASLLYAVPINPDTTSYFAYGLEAMSLAVLGSDSTWPSLTLFTSASLPQEDQALGGALVSAIGQIGRALGLAIATAVQLAVMAAHRGGINVQDTGPVVAGDAASLAGLRASFWFNTIAGACSVMVIALAFRGTGVIGKISAPRSRAAKPRECPSIVSRP